MLAAGCLDRFAQRAFNVGARHRAQGVPFGAAQEGENVVVDDVADAGS